MMLYSIKLGLLLKWYKILDLLIYLTDSLLKIPNSFSIYINVPVRAEM
jgi:hypothetical protein